MKLFSFLWTLVVHINREHKILFVKIKYVCFVNRGRFEWFLMTFFFWHDMLFLILRLTFYIFCRPFIKNKNLQVVLAYHPEASIISSSITIIIKKDQLLWRWDVTTAHSTYSTWQKRQFCFFWNDCYQGIDRFPDFSRNINIS